MRAAKREDYRRRLAERSYRLVLVEFFAPDLGDAVPLASPITAICGPNGAGKTRLLKALWQTLSGLREVGDPLGAFSNATLRYRFNGVGNDAVFSQEAGRKLPDEHGKVYQIQPPHYALTISRYLRSVPDLAEFLEGYAPATMKPADVTRLSYLVNRQYESVLVYEIDDPGGDNDTPRPMPYFEVASLGRSYGSEAMGLGELSLFCLWWNISRVEHGSLLLIDEPEAFVSPHSQYALFDEMVRLCVERELTMVLATQSQPIIDSIEAASIRMLLPAAPGMAVLAGPPRARLMNTLGMVVPKSGLLLVEDGAATFVTTGAIGMIAGHLLQVLDVVPMNGTGPLTQALKMPSFGNQWFRLIGVLDGDQRDKEHQGLQWPALYLPGTTSPDAALRSVLAGNEVRVAADLGRPPADIQMAQVRTAGIDDHDWLVEMSRACGVSWEQLASVLFRLWFARDEDSFRALVEEIQNQIQ